jgi:hypothetical protein
MRVLGYYLIALLNLLVCWKCITSERGAWRPFWLSVGLAILTLPLWLPVRLAFYYGLVASVSLFFWSADTYMQKGIRRFRGVVGGVLLLPVPFFIAAVQERWSAALLLPTLGHLAVTAASWPIVVGVLAKAAGEDHDKC